MELLSCLKGIVEYTHTQRMWELARTAMELRPELDGR